MRSLRSKAGFTLLEILVAMAILTVGLLGIASLHMVSLQNTNSAYLRSQSVLISNDLVERIRNNRKLLAYAMSTNIDSSGVTISTPGGETSQQVPNPDADSNPCNSSAGCSDNALIQAELKEWRQTLTRLGDITQPIGAKSAPVHVTLIYDATKELFELVINWQNKQWSKTLNNTVTREYKSSSYKFLVAIN